MFRNAHVRSFYHFVARRIRSVTLLSAFQMSSKAEGKRPAGRPRKSSYLVAGVNQTKLSFGFQLVRPLSAPVAPAPPVMRNQQVDLTDCQLSTSSSLGPSASTVFTCASEASEIVVENQLLKRQLDTLVRAEVTDVLRRMVDTVIARCALEGVKKRRTRMNQAERVHLASAFTKLREEYPEETRSSVAGRMKEELKLGGTLLPQQLSR